MFGRPKAEAAPGAVALLIFSASVPSLAFRFSGTAAGLPVAAPAVVPVILPELVAEEVEPAVPDPPLDPDGGLVLVMVVFFGADPLSPKIHKK